MPSTGQILKLGSLGLPGQLGQGEREGADSDRPEWEGRMALSYQLDKAKGVAPAQIALSGFYGKRTSIAFNSSSQYTTMCTDTPNYCVVSERFYRVQQPIWRPTRRAGAHPMVHVGGERLSRWRPALLLRRADQHLCHRYGRVGWDTRTAPDIGWRSASCRWWRRAWVQRRT